jgi:hypothetical protein
MINPKFAARRTVAPDPLTVWLVWTILKFSTRNQSGSIWETIDARNAFSDQTVGRELALAQRGSQMALRVHANTRETKNRCDERHTNQSESEKRSEGEAHD